MLQISGGRIVMPIYRRIAEIEEDNQPVRPGRSCAIEHPQENVFCQLEAGHTGPHKSFNMDGSVNCTWAIDDNDVDFDSNNEEIKTHRKTVMFTMDHEQVDTVKEVFFFDCDKKKAFQKAFNAKIFPWAEKPNDIEVETMGGDIFCFEFVDFKWVV